ncbi:hypothetical protein SAMN05443244_0555 [Terriglobus roseus]|uniref:Uncharacterized protein n=1 Tax=Terriglobus roseus TaxID=392734 RepID=A0A1H4JES8_9BACT|nr:hypothetical protein SAMN05443244_0555 [Terriglobus roseus]
MSLETDLAGLTGRHLSGLFDGPDNEEILQCVLLCLPDVERIYWQELQNAPGDVLHDAITPVFLAFEARLRVAGIEERSTDVEPCKKTVGPILDVHDLGQ